VCEVFIESPFAVRMYTASHLFAHQLFIYSQQPDQIRAWCQTVTALSRFVAAILKYTLISNTGWNALFLSSHNAQIGLTQSGKLTMSFCWYLFLDVKITDVSQNIYGYWSAFWFFTTNRLTNIAALYTLHYR